MRRARDIPAAIVALRIAVAEAYGANRDTIIREAKLTQEIITNPQSRVTVEQAMDVWKSIVRQTGSHDIGLECGLKARFQTMGILGYVMMNSSSIIKAWTKLCNYQELVLSIVLQKIGFDRDLIIFEGMMQEDWQDEFRYTIDFIYASCLTLIKNCTYQDIHPLEVGFNFPKPSNVKKYHKIFDPSIIKFSCEHPYIAYRKSDLEKPITAYDPNLFEHFDALLKEVAFEHEGVNANTRAVRNVILKRLKAEIPKLHEVANELAISVRSLQVALKNEGTTYQNILNDARKKVAMQQLGKAHNNVTDVAFLTGYSDLSVFSRNFKKWTGLSPSEYQSHHR